MTKTPHEIFDGSDHELIPPEHVWIHGWDGDNLNEAHWSVCGVNETDVKYVRADIAEQATAKERAEILEIINQVAADSVCCGRSATSAISLIQHLIKQRGEVGK